MNSPQLGSRIRQARIELGLSGTELARRIGKSQPYISDLERGQRTPSLPTLKALAEALDKPVTYFLAADDSTERASEWPERAVPTPQVAELTRHLADRTVEQLLNVGLLRTDEKTDRDALVRMVHRALVNAYHEMRPASRRRPAAGSAVR